MSFFTMFVAVAVKAAITGLGENKEINFSNGINVIQGNNEAGKSTLLKFITSMFYGTARTKNGKNISDFEKYKPWRKEEYSGKITYTLDNNEEYEVYREFKKKSPIIYDEQKNDITKNYPIDKNKDSMFFIEQTGITEENFFASCVAEQEGVRLSSNMKNSIIQKLSNIVSSGSENISYKKTLDKLNKRQLEEIGSSRSAGRPLNLVEEEIEKKVNHLIELVGLTEHKNKYPRQLSGGQKQRVALARLLIYNAEAILLDEPFSALDEDLKDELLKEMKTKLDAYHRPVVFVSHNKDEIIALSHEMYIIKNGEIIMLKVS